MPSAAVQIKINNWQAFQGRTDYKRCWWFKTSNQLFTESDWFGMTNDARCLWLFLLCEASKINHNEIRVIYEHASLFVKMSVEEIEITIRDFESKQWVTLIRTDSVQIPIGFRTDSGRQSKSNSKNKSKKENIVENDKPKELPELARLWNEQMTPLFAAIRGCSAARLRHARNRWRDHPSQSYWLEIFIKIKANKFLCGNNDRGWKANFDWLLRPDTGDKVLEGNYGSASNAMSKYKALD